LNPRTFFCLLQVSINRGGKALDIRIHVHREVISPDFAYFESVSKQTVPTQTQILSKAKRFVDAANQQHRMLVWLRPVVISRFV
jgi:hypothetical protein